MRFALPSFALAVIVLVGCAGGAIGSRPPDSQIRVDPSYVSDPASPPRVAVVLGVVAVADSGGVARHVGGEASDADATYRAFFADRLPASMFEMAHVGEVRVLDASPYERGSGGLRPTNGARITFEGFEADLVLLLDSLHVGRSVYVTFSPSGSNEDERLRIDARMTLWDNRDGAEVASGRLETQRGIGSINSLPSRRMYEAAVGEFVEQLARFTPIDLRTEVQRRARRG